MPYISPMSVKRIRDDAAAADLASSLARTTLDDAAPASSEFSNRGSNTEASNSESTSDSNSTTASDSQPTETAPEPEVIDVDSKSAVEPLEAITDASTSTAIPSRSGSLTPDAPSLISCATGSSSSVRTLSSTESDSLEPEVVEPTTEAEEQKHAELNPHAHHHEIAHTDCADLRDVDVDAAAPELADYHRGIYAFTKEMYDRAMWIANRRKARGQTRVRISPQRAEWL